MSRNRGGSRQNTFGEKRSVHDEKSAFNGPKRGSGRDGALNKQQAGRQEEYREAEGTRLEYQYVRSATG